MSPVPLGTTLLPVMEGFDLFLLGYSITSTTLALLQLLYKATFGYFSKKQLLYYLISSKIDQKFPFMFCISVVNFQSVRSRVQSHTYSVVKHKKKMIKDWPWSPRSLWQQPLKLSRLWVVYFASLVFKTLKHLHFA